MFQVDGHEFNRGLYKNIGYMEALRYDRFTCVVFQDLDLLPEDDYNLYHCPDQPRHLVVGINTYKYRSLLEERLTQM
jgi:hypothetical protein